MDFAACFPDIVVGFVPSDGVSGEYIEFFIRTARESLDKYAPATAQKNINLEILSHVAVPLPPMDEQRQVCSRAQEELSKIDDVKRTLDADVSRSAALRQSILKAAFAGQLVPQDPNDEPASALLERIAAKRARAAPAKARRGRKRSAFESALQSD